MNAIHERPDPAGAQRSRSQPDRGVEDAAPRDDAASLRAVLRAVWRRSGVIVGIVLLCLILSVLVLFQLTPLYTATALLTLDPRRESVVDIEAVISGLSPDASVINTELDILTSGRLVGKLVDAQGLTRDPEFNAALRPADPLVRLIDPRTYMAPEWLTALGIPQAEEVPLSEEERRDREREAVIGAVTDALTVSNPTISYTIRISFETEDARKSARLANGLAELYLTDQLEAKFEATERATQWLSTRISDLRDRVREAEQAVQRYRQAHQIVQASETATVSEQQLGEVNTQLIEAETELAAVEARYNQVRDLAGRGSYAALGAVLDSALIQRLREQEAQVRRRQAEVLSRYGERHPEVAEVGAELRDIRSKIGEEVNRIVSGVANEVTVARSRVAALQVRLEALKATSAEVESARVDLRELEREAESSRVLLETFLSRFKETTSQEDLQQADARIISQAKVSNDPSYPKKKLILSIAFVLAVMLALGIAVLLELLDHGYRTLDHVQREIRLTGLGMVPRLSRRKLRGRSPVEYVLSSPASAYAEALRSVYNTLTYGQVPAPKAIAVTSSLPGEGKTTFTLSLARLLARAGNQRVLFVEADLRRNAVWRALASKKDHPLSLEDYLLGTAPTWRDCVHTDAASNLDMIVTSGRTENVQALLQSGRMEVLSREAREHYDLILFDTPPVLAVSDAVLLSKHADTTVLLVRWESTARAGVRSTISMLRKAEVPVGGVVMTQVDLRKHAKYGYGDYASYYGRYGQYYTS
ncbi:GumC family protein [Roseospira marina]|uniref:GumC family protein n=1 Tax=Roseospira marina TaxID=140057 RepID=UPI001478A055|nr:polysaccharide biosynthesis tyrosine autokinase [Roseospira marina]MBB4315666.1 exopolysaccharide transport family protein [Roseospira marina]MBB5088724.1 exopolysaccharide transport family protein [Roseospira marina]